MGALVKILSVFAVQTPSSPFLPEPWTRRPSTASENSAGWPSFLILVSWVTLTLVSGFPGLPLSVKAMLVESMLAIVPRNCMALGRGGAGVLVAGGVESG